MNENNKNEIKTEKRKYVRIAEKDILQCKKFTAEDLQSEETSEHIKAVTINISVGGILFESDIKFDIGELLKLEIDISGWEKFRAEFYKEDATSTEQPLIVLANVIRVEVIEPDIKYDIGACISAIDEGHKWAIMKYIDNKVKVNT